MDKPPVAPYLVADQILWSRAELNVHPTTPMHVLKLSYLAHGWLLGWENRALINEPVEAWTYGPVVPSLYHRYKSFGAGSIKVEMTDRSASFDEDQLETVNFVINSYSDFSALELSQITHEEGTPWHTVKETSGLGAIIPNDLIARYYHDLIIEEAGLAP